jgi:integrative and conjugative element protein (TIGR02256 family)
MPGVTVTVPQNILTGIFDECDRYDVCETGGRVLGFYRGSGEVLKIDVCALIGPGPNARRTATSLFQDGEYQERLFRAVEKQHPTIQHLGNWHTHHCNGLEVLSAGDGETYRKHVNSKNHNTNFWYALLVTRKTPNQVSRYAVKHYILFRGDGTIYEIPPAQVDVTDARVLQLAAR